MITTNLTSPVNRAACEAANEDVPGKGEIYVAESKRARNGDPRVKVRPLGGSKSYSAGVTIRCGGATVEAILASVPLAIATAKHRINGGGKRGEVPASILDPIKAKWAERLKANPAIRKSAEEALLFDQATRRKSYQVKLTVFGANFPSVLAAGLPAIVKAGIFSDRAIAAMTVSNPKLQGGKPVPLAQFLKSPMLEKAVEASEKAARKAEAAKAAKAQSASPKSQAA